MSLDFARKWTPLGAFLRLAAPVGTGTVAFALSCTTAPAVPPPQASAENAAHVAATPTPAGPHSWLGSPTIQNEVDGSVPPLLALDTLDAGTVEAEVRRRMGDLQACYERRLMERPRLAGHIEIHWTISPEGDVVEQCSGEDTVQDPALLVCASTLVSGSHYPTSGAPFSVSYPFEFEPGPAPGPGPLPLPTPPT